MSDQSSFKRDQLKINLTLVLSFFLWVHAVFSFLRQGPPGWSPDIDVIACWFCALNIWRKVAQAAKALLGNGQWPVTGASRLTRQACQRLTIVMKVMFAIFSLLCVWLLISPVLLAIPALTSAMVAAFASIFPGLFWASGRMLLSAESRKSESPELSGGPVRSDRPPGGAQG